MPLCTCRTMARCAALSRSRRTAVAVILLLLGCSGMSVALDVSHTLLGDPNMSTPGIIRVATEAWNFCNRAGPQATPSPRYADCYGAHAGATRDSGNYGSEVEDARQNRTGAGPFGNLITRAVNELTPPTAIPGVSPTPTSNDAYAEVKERYLGDLCALPAPSNALGASDRTGRTWSFWTLMAKSGNIDHALGWCPETLVAPPAVHVPPLASPAARNIVDRHQAWTEGNGGSGTLPMNQPVVFHNWTVPGDCIPTDPVSGVLLDLRGAWGVDTASPATRSHCGSFWGSWNLDAPRANASSRFSTVWYRPAGGAAGSTVFHHTLTCSTDYPWLMWYHRADSVANGNGGYPWQGRGMLLQPFTAADDVTMSIFMNITSTTSSRVQFYLPEMGGCWKADGSPCDGDLTTDITRYICFILNPHVHPGCSATSQQHCPPIHTFTNGSVVARNDTKRFPYQCYYYWCAPPNDPSASESEKCDPYSNPMQQEIMQILPCSEWEGTGFPTVLGQGWVGDGRHWTLDVTALARRMYVSGQAPMDKRQYLSLETGPEMPDPGQRVQWVVSDWDVVTAA